ncbi:MAG: D-Ala-D-Ala carboxypeptidase family metallohydrolase [Sneathiella sp.]
MSDWNPETTPNFTREEMACNCGFCGNSCEMRQDFMEKLQTMRDMLGQPVTMNSGYRCARHPNERHKPEPGSHTQGQAGDLKVESASIGFELLDAAIKVGMVGIGVANGFLHVDSGHDTKQRPALWGGY